MTHQGDDFRKVYEFSDWVRNTEMDEVGGETRLTLLPDFEQFRYSLVLMEAMARDIEASSDISGYEIQYNEQGTVVVVSGSFSNRYYSLRRFFHEYAFRDRYVFSPHVSAVCEALEALDLHPNTFTFGEPDEIDYVLEKTYGEVFNEVLDKVAEIVRSPGFRERLRVRKRNAERNQAKGLLIEQKVFAAKSRRLVLMLHFGYQKKYRSEITPEEIQKHRQKFFNNRRMNKLLRGIVDYIWKLEEGDESGLHLHVLIFYTADSCRDVLIAKKIGEYWVQVVTEGKGQYWNSNANKALHQTYGHGIGTGEINRHDEAKREALRENIRYMTKADQYLHMKYGPNFRLFGTSMPQAKQKSGRPSRPLN